MALSNAWLLDLAQLLLVFVCSAHYITNRYLVAKLIEVMFVVNPRVQPALSKISDMLLNSELAFGHLAPALMKFYAGGCFGHLEPPTSLTL